MVTRIILTRNMESVQEVKDLILKGGRRLSGGSPSTFSR